MSGRERRVRRWSARWWFSRTSSGFCMAVFFGRNSPKSSMMYVMSTMESASESTVACGRKGASSAPMSGASKAPLAAPSSTPMSVMPICATESASSGSSRIASAAAASSLPSSASRSRRLRWLSMSAVSMREKKLLSKSKTTINTSSKPASVLPKI